MYHLKAEYIKSAYNSSSHTCILIYGSLVRMYKSGVSELPERLLLVGTFPCMVFFF